MCKQRQRRSQTAQTMKEEGEGGGGRNGTLQDAGCTDNKVCAYFNETKHFLNA